MSAYRVSAARACPFYIPSSARVLAAEHMAASPSEKRELMTQARRASVTATRWTTPFHGSATRDANTAKATALPSARTRTGRLTAAQSGSPRKRRASTSGAATIAPYATPLATSCTWLCHDSPAKPGPALPLLLPQLGLLPTAVYCRAPL